MKIKLIAALVFVFIAGIAQGQEKYFTKTGKIEFSSKAALEDIEAKNKTATAVLDTKSGALQFSVVMRGFEFDRALMQEHFNDNYVESHKFPKADFTGSIINNNQINYSKDGTYTAKVKGKMTLHGETKNVETIGTVKVSGGKIETTSTFNLLLSDYKIKIPAAVINKLSNSIKITVDCNLEPLKG